MIKISFVIISIISSQTLIFTVNRQKWNLDSVVMWQVKPPPAMLTSCMMPAHVAPAQQLILLHANVSRKDCLSAWTLAVLGSSILQAWLCYCGQHEYESASEIVHSPCLSFSLCNSFKTINAFTRWNKTFSTLIFINASLFKLFSRGKLVSMYLVCSSSQFQYFTVSNK